MGVHTVCTMLNPYEPSNLLVWYGTHILFTATIGGFLGAYAGGIKGGMEGLVYGAVLGTLPGCGPFLILEIYGLLSQLNLDAITCVHHAIRAVLICHAYCVHCRTRRRVEMASHHIACARSLGRSKRGIRYSAGVWAHYDHCAQGHRLMGVSL